MSELEKARREYERLLTELGLPPEVALVEVLRDYDVEMDELIGQA